ncbi:MAG: hypothetical protein M3347_05190, partial [Armatimonadota bacterium]|nr:hypothetical protein [Armatimonadota bacterium]
VLALHGAFGDSEKERRPEERRSALVALAMVILLLILAFGAYTPLFKFLYHYVPGFDKFRTNAKFMFPASLFLALLAGRGFNSLLRSPRLARPLAIMTLVLGLMVVATSAWIQISAASGTASVWGQFVRNRPTEFYPAEFYFSPLYQRPDFTSEAAVFAATSLRIGGAVCLLLSLLLFLMKRRHRPAAYAIAGLALLEILIWSRMNRPTFDLAAARHPELEQFLRAHPGDYRTLTLALGSDSAFFAEAQEIAGYEPYGLQRYADFIAFTQSDHPDGAGYHRLFSMLRCRYVFIPRNQQRTSWFTVEHQDVLPHVLLLHDYAVIQGRDAIFAAMAQPTFNPRRQVILESVPQPRPEKSKTSDPKQVGTAKIVDSSTDHLTIVAELPRPAILLITDNYSAGWRAVALPDSVQQQYQLLPANYLLRAIPLGVGRHHLRVEYSPAAFRIGAVVSLASLILYLALLGWHLRACSNSNRRRGVNLGVSPASSALAAGVPSENAALPTRVLPDADRSEPKDNPA